jgi:hypothetical protein
MEKASENLTALKSDLPIVGSSRRIAYFIFFASCLFLIALETYFKPKGFEAFYFQNLTSDAMMQTLPVVLLKNQPITGLYFLHIQPPLLDAIRTLLAIVSPYNQNPGLLRFVDTGMYFIWMLFFGALNTIIYAWVARATNIYFFIPSQQPLMPAIIRRAYCGINPAVKSCNPIFLVFRLVTPRGQRNYGIDTTMRKPGVTIWRTALSFQPG